MPPQAWILGYRRESAFDGRCLHVHLSGRRIEPDFDAELSPELGFPRLAHFRGDLVRDSDHRVVDDLPDLLAVVVQVPAEGLPGVLRGIPCHVELLEGLKRRASRGLHRYGDEYGRALHGGSARRLDVGAMPTHGPPGGLQGCRPAPRAESSRMYSTGTAIRSRTVGTSGRKRRKRLATRARGSTTCDVRRCGISSGPESVARWQ